MDFSFVDISDSGDKYLGTVHRVWRHDNMNHGRYVSTVIATVNVDTGETSAIYKKFHLGLDVIVLWHAGEKLTVMIPPST